MDRGPYPWPSSAEPLALPRLARAPLDTIEEMADSLLHKAARSGDPEIVSRLIQGGLDVNQGNGYKDTPLGWAIYEGHVEIVRMLIDAGAKVKDEDLFSSSAMKKPEIMSLLISAGVNPTATDVKGRTVLAVARESANSAVIHFLEKAIRSK